MGIGTVKRAVPSIMSADLKIVGDVTWEGEVHIDGVVDGNITGNIVLIGETGTINGEVRAESVTVHGAVNGQTMARNVSLAKTARVAGHVLYENLSIERGAFLEGHCKRISEKRDLVEGRVTQVKDPTQSASVAPIKGPARAAAQAAVS